MSLDHRYLDLVREPSSLCMPPLVRSQATHLGPIPSVRSCRKLVSKKTLVCKPISGIINSLPKVRKLNTSWTERLPPSVMWTLAPSGTISWAVFRFGRLRTSFNLWWKDSFCVAHASISNCLTAKLCSREYPCMIWGILSTWLLRRYASFNALWEVSQISVENCGKHPYRGIWSAQWPSKCILGKLKCESSTKASLTKQARSCLSAAKVRTFWAAVRSFCFSCSSLCLFCPVSSLETMSALPLAALLARNLRNTSFVSWNRC